MKTPQLKFLKPKLLKEEKIIRIIKTANLIYLNDDTVKNLFKRAYKFLEEKEDFEEAAEIKKKEKSYQRKLKYKKGKFKQLQVKKVV